VLSAAELGYVRDEARIGKLLDAKLLRVFGDAWQPAGSA
jgi:hypothetical protein